jgi:hypothetical protein
MWMGLDFAINLDGAWRFAAGIVGGATFNLLTKVKADASTARGLNNPDVIITTARTSGEIIANRHPRFMPRSVMS